MDLDPLTSNRREKAVLAPVRAVVVADIAEIDRHTLPSKSRAAVRDALSRVLGIIDHPDRTETEDPR